MKKFFAALLICLFVTATAFAATPDINYGRNEIYNISKRTLAKLYEKYPDAKRALAEGYGYVTLRASADKTFPTIPKGVGVGIAYNNKTGEKVYVSMKPKTPGAQFMMSKYTLWFS